MGNLWSFYGVNTIGRSASRNNHSGTMRVTCMPEEPTRILNAPKSRPTRRYMYILHVLMRLARSQNPGDPLSRAQHYIISATSWQTWIQGNGCDPETKGTKCVTLSPRRIYPTRYAAVDGNHVRLTTREPPPGLARVIDTPRGTRCAYVAPHTPPLLIWGAKPNISGSISWS